MRSLFARRAVRRRLLFSALAALAVWLGFFDSHSVWRRVGYERERASLARENEGLAAEIARLDAQVEAGLPAGAVEEVAREQYGMRRPGETVYRVEGAED